MRIRELPRFDLKTVIPVASTYALGKVAEDGECSWLPLIHDVAKLVQHQPRVVEELCSAPAKIDPPAPGRSYGSTVQAREQRVLDNPDVIDRRAEQGLERGTHGRWQIHRSSDQGHWYSWVRRPVAGHRPAHGIVATVLRSMIYTVGHSNHSIERFIGLLVPHGISALADVRSTPYSRFNPQFRRERLQTSLAESGIQYVFLGEELGARTPDPACYDTEGRVSYTRLAQTPLFRRGIGRLKVGMATHRIAIMCAEREPGECHRTLLVARELVRDGVGVMHIMGDGSLESHEQVMERLAASLGLTGSNESGDLFSNGAGRSEADRLEEAYRLQAAKIGYVRKSG